MPLLRRRHRVRRPEEHPGKGAVEGRGDAPRPWREVAARGDGRNGTGGDPSKLDSLSRIVCCRWAVERRGSGDECEAPLCDRDSRWRHGSPSRSTAASRAAIRRNCMERSLTLAELCAARQRPMPCSAGSRMASRRRKPGVLDIPHGGAGIGLVVCSEAIEDTAPRSYPCR